MEDPKFVTERKDLVREEDLPPIPSPNPALAPVARAYEPKILAHALVVAEYEGDQAALRKFGVTQAELDATRRAFYEAPGSNRPLVTAVRQVRDAMATTLNEKLMGAQVAMADFLTRAATKADATDPQAIEKVTKGLEAVSEILLAARMVDARLNDRPPPRQVLPLRQADTDDDAGADDDSGNG